MRRREARGPDGDGRRRAPRNRSGEESRAGSTERLEEVLPVGSPADVGAGEAEVNASEAAVPALASVPKSGMIIPDMGTLRRARRTGMADALFTPVQQRVLALLFGQPERRYQSAELIRLAKGGTGAVHRQLARLAAAGLVTVTHTGNQKHYQARRDAPVFEELHGLVVKTVGLVQPLRRALASSGRRSHRRSSMGRLRREATEPEATSTS